MERKDMVPEQAQSLSTQEAAPGAERCLQHPRQVVRATAAGKRGPGRGASGAPRPDAPAASVLEFVPLEGPGPLIRREMRKREVYTPPISTFRWWASTV